MTRRWLRGWRTSRRPASRWGSKRLKTVFPSPWTSVSICWDSSATGRIPTRRPPSTNGAERPGWGFLVSEQLHGKELSYNNYLDLDGALLCLAPFVLSPKPAVCIVKHTTPAGLAVGDSLANAYRRALRTDPLSSFGSVIAVNRAVDAATADAMSELFIECIVAPGYDEDALGILTRKKNVRLLVMPDGSVSDDDLPVDPSRFDWWGQASDAERATARFVAAHGGLPSAQVVRSVYGGLLVQSPPTPPFYGVADPDWKVVTGRAPGVVELDDLRFAWAAVSGVKSKRDPAREGRSDPRDRRGPDEPRGRLRAGSEEGRKGGPRPHGFGPRVGRVLPVPGRRGRGGPTPV